MKTTNLFVELIVVGIGAFTLLFILAMIVFDVNWQNLQFNNYSIAILPITAITYLFGILFDRISDRLSDKLDKKIRAQYFTSKIEYLKTSHYLYDNSDLSKELIDYSRSRMRICRAWYWYWIPMGLLSSIFLLYRVTTIDLTQRILLSIGIMSFAILFTYISRFALKGLIKGFYSRLYFTIKIKENPDYKAEEDERLSLEERAKYRTQIN